jgi:hypothetical protein
MVEFDMVSFGEPNSYFVHRSVDCYDHCVIFSTGAGVELGSVLGGFVVTMYVILTIGTILSFVYVVVGWTSVVKKG